MSSPNTPHLFEQILDKKLVPPELPSVSNPHQTELPLTKSPDIIVSA